MADKITPEHVRRAIVRKDARARRSNVKHVSHSKAARRIDVLEKVTWRGVGEGGTSPG